MPQSQRIYKDGLPDYDAIRDRLKKAVRKMLDKDYDLVALGGHEQAVAHRIAVYLERLFPGFQTDCEYNRNKHKAKNLYPETPSDETTMRPDIIVHHRDTADNVLAIEMKMNANSATTSDLKKLKSLKSEKTYLYSGVAFVCVRNAIDEMVSGHLTATIDWYEVKPTGIVPEVGNQQIVTCKKHADKVKAIVNRRKGRE